MRSRSRQKIYEVNIYESGCETITFKIYATDLENAQKIIAQEIRGKLDFINLVESKTKRLLSLRIQTAATITKYPYPGGKSYEAGINYLNPKKGNTA